jgi:DNA repair protein RecO (recombination protein O)
MRSYSLEGIIIKRSNVGEANKVLTFYSKERGKVSLLAKGIRKLQSKRAGSLELFNQVQLMAVLGNGNLDVITEVSVINTFTSWKKHIGRINIAYQLSEVVDKITPENEPHLQIYNTLLNAFMKIDELGENWKVVLDHWLLSILIDLGYWSKDDVFSGDLFQYIKEISNRHLHSPGILKRLR